jgi:hypothetical protein
MVCVESNKWSESTFTPLHMFAVAHLNLLRDKAEHTLPSQSSPKEPHLKNGVVFGDKDGLFTNYCNIVRSKYKYAKIGFIETSLQRFHGIVVSTECTGISG